MSDQQKTPSQLANTTGYYAFNSGEDADAGKWRTWLIPSGNTFRLPPPKDTTKEEINKLLLIQEGQKNSDWVQRIAYWHAGSPAFRWKQVLQRFFRTDTSDVWPFATMLLNVVLYDAIIAAWDSKYSYARLRPYLLSPLIKTYAVKSESPSYPCEYAVTAGAAVTVIAHFYPREMKTVDELAREMMEARVRAGMSFPSDSDAGYALGQKIAEYAISKTKDFIPSTPWDGKIPNKPGLWNGTNPWNPLLGTWKTVVLSSGSQFRPGPPPDFKLEMDELRAFKPTPRSMANAFYHATQYFWEEATEKKIFEYNLHLSPPLAARVYALTGIASYDALVASFDAKYTYWGIRPDQYDTNYRPPLMETPRFPGYPAGHSTVASVYATIMSYLFPSDKDYFWRKALEAAESRFQGGVHFRSDNEVGIELGKKVGDLVVERAQQMLRDNF